MGTDHDDRDRPRRDVNGRPVPTSGWRRLLGRRSPATAPSVTDADLVLVAESTDESAAGSSVLGASAWRKTDQAVLRHLLALPVDEVEAASGVAAQEGYEPVPVSPFPVQAPLIPVALARVQLIDAMHLAQERARMAGLAVRHGGTVIGWQVLQRPSGDDGQTPSGHR